ncbi:MAG TPA: VWA domain-containing protein [Thermoanaerobaculia bacterium]|jgi:VWFA-related protein
MKFAVLVLAVAAAFAIDAQETPQLAESIEVRVTNLDVVVTDRSGKPVTGLTAEDFEIYESGTQQPISNFYEVTAQSTSVAEREVMPARNRRRIVVFVDNFSITPLLRNQALQAFERSLDTLMRPEDEAMLVFWNQGLEIVTPLTSDRNLLVTRFREASKRSAGGTTVESQRRSIAMLATRLLDEANSNQTGRSHKVAYALSLEAARSHGELVWSAGKMLIEDMKRTITTLSGVEGKKALIFIGAELPEHPALELFQEIDSMYFPFIRDIKPAALRDADRRLIGGMTELANHANANGVTMYMVDGADRSRLADASEKSPYDMDTVNQAEVNTPRALRQIAWSTGGIAVPSGKNFASALKTVAGDLSSYYSLGYRSPEGDDVTARRVTVKVKRDGMNVRTRDTYVPKSDEDRVRERLIANVFHAGRIVSDFEVTLDTGSIERKNNGRSVLPLVVTFPSSITLIADGDSLAGSFEVSIVTGLENGALSRVSTSLQPLKFAAADRSKLDAAKTLSFRAPLEISKGPQIVSVAVTDKLAGTTGFARVRVSGD